MHCVVPGGGIALDGNRWIASRPGFFLPVRVLSRLFRRLFLEGLRAAFHAGDLQFFGDLLRLNQARAFAEALAPVRAAEWIVYAKKTFAGSEQLLAYLSRYTHRVAITNGRLLEVREKHVSFRWKKYRRGGGVKRKVMRLEVTELIRRFLLHVLPNGFHRIRHYGFLANGHRANKLVICRDLLARSSAPPIVRWDEGDRERQNLREEPPPCPCCGGWRVRVVETFTGSLCRPYPPRRPDAL